MIRDQIRDLKTSPRELRRFGLTVGAVFALWGAWLVFRHKPLAPYPLGVGALLIGLGALGPAVLRPIYVAWMALAFALGWVVSTILLTLFFYLVVTPIGLLARALGQDFLDRRWDLAASTYWRPRRKPEREEKSSYERQF
jgi:hypothetical protein